MNNNDEKSFIESYNIKKYEQPSVAADIAVFTIQDVPVDNYRKLAEKRLRLLMIKRGRHPFKDYYALPGGFARKDETVDETALRELWEETGVKDIFPEQLKTTSTPGRDPRGWIISAAYLALVDSSRLNVCGGDDAASAEWFDVSFKSVSKEAATDEKGIYTSVEGYELKLSCGENILSADIRYISTVSSGGVTHSVKVESSRGIAFDHAEIISYAIIRLRNKTIYEGAAFSLLPEKFTMGDLQRVYEILLDKEEPTANFRRKMSEYVIPTEDIRQSGGHRPSVLMRRNMEAFI